MASDRKKILEILRDACDRGIIVINVSQCRKGLVSNIYESGNVLTKIGVIFAGDMTVECALTKPYPEMALYPDTTGAVVADRVKL